MTAVYLLVILAPLAPAVLHSAMLAHVLTGECTGDCRSCGCSPERTATRACCCWQKKLAGVNALKPPTEHNSCPTSTATAYTKKSGSCCSKPAQHSDHEDQTSGPMQATSTTDISAQTVSISICPCGSGKDMSVASGKTIQHIPFSFSSGLPLQLVSRLDFLQPERFASRYGEPPDPPPKAYISS
jgi:hypothetical protein